MMKIQLPILGQNPTTDSYLATAFSIPWCCVLPAVLSLTSVSISIATHLWLSRLQLIFIPVSFILLGRSFWLLYIKNEGRKRAWISWVSAGIVALLTIMRF